MLSIYIYIYIYMVVHVLLHSMPYGYCTGEMREVVEVRLHDHEVMRLYMWREYQERFIVHNTSKLSQYI